MLLIIYINIYIFLNNIYKHLEESLAGNICHVSIIVIIIMPTITRERRVIFIGLLYLNALLQATFLLSISGINL